MKKSITLDQSSVRQESGGIVKTFLKNISPFNNSADMPTALLVVKKLLAFFICYAAGIALGNIIIIAIMLACGIDIAQGETFSDSVMCMLSLYSVAGMIAASAVYWKLIEKKNLAEMGVTKNISFWFVGAFIGAGLLFACIAAITLTGTVRYEGISLNIDIPMSALMFGGYAVQGAAEEFLCRGLVFGSLKGKTALPTAIAVNTVTFILPHNQILSSEPQYIFSGIISLIVFSCLLSFLTMRTKNIWTACGLHSIWNFCLSCVLGLELSGLDSSSLSVINMSTVGENLMNGGKYGIEASIITGVILAAASFAVWYSIKKKGREA